MSDTLSFEDRKVVSDTIGQGGVTPRQIGSTAISRTLADINLDGRLDYVYCPGDWPTGEILTFPYLWLQDENGGFQSVAVDATPTLSFPGSVFVKDFNNDGLMDIYVATLGNEEIIPEESTPDVLYLQQDDGSFQVDDRVDLPKNWAHGATVGDLNDDGWMDVLSTNGTGSGTYIFWGSRNGFQVELTDLTGDPTYHPPYERDVIHRARIQDFDGDGRSDLLIGASGWNSPIAEGEDVPIFPSEIIYSYGRADERRVALPIPEVPWMDPWAYEITNSQIGDLDGDGDMDLVISYMNNGGFVYEGNFYPSWEAETFGVSVDPSETNRIIQVLRNDGDHYTDVSEHDPRVTLRETNLPFEVNIADFNSDGHLDIFLDPAEHGEAASILLGDGNFGFHEPESVHIQDHPEGELGDLDGNGTLDIVNAWEQFDEPFSESSMVAWFGIGTPSIWYGTSNDDSVRLSSQRKAFTGVGDDNVIGSGARDVVRGGWNNDTLDGRGGRDRLYGEHGQDYLKGGSGKDILSGGAQDDQIFGGGQSDKLLGGGGRDRLKGDNGADRLIGGGGSDVLIAGKGRDVIFGGRGSDVFVFADANGHNVIRDFEATDDSEVMNLAKVTGIRGFRDLTNNHLTQIGDDALIDDHSGTAVVLRGVSVSDLDRDDFLF